MKLLSVKINERKTKISVHEPGDKITAANCECILDDLDWENNQPPIGFLWARRLDDISPLPKMILSKLPEDMTPGEQPELIPNPHYQRIEGPREVVGIVHIVTREFIPVTKAQNFLTNVRDKLVLELLYKALCAPAPLHIRVWEKIKGWFKK
jgi:hypothetical protein